MAPAIVEKYEELRVKTTRASRLTLTELARGKKWREDLPACGLIELTDRSETAGWLLSDEYMEEMVSLVDGLLVEQEQRQVQAMLDARADYQDWCSGDVLAQRALKSFEERKDSLKAACRGGE